MNCPTRDPEPTGNPTFNQSPPLYERSLVPRSSPVCGGGSLSKDEYNMGLHVAALFIILAQSTFACAFPLIAKRFPRLRIPRSFLFFARHFGTGVLIATAFAHLLPTAFTSLTDPCLPPLWNQKYPAMAGVIAMAAVFLVTLVEMIFTKGICAGGYSQEDHRHATLESGHTTSSSSGGRREKGISGGSTSSGEDEGEWRERVEAVVVEEAAEDEGIGGKGGVGQVGFGMVGRRRSRGHSIGLELQKFSLEMNTAARRNTITSIPPSQLTRAFPTPTTLTPEQTHKRAMLQCILLEMGILFHSLFIGMAISVTTGPGFIVLLIAIIFHQTFEGLALGSRIATLKWPDRAVKPWFMALAYGLTTPIGQALGLATHTLYRPDSMTGLLVVGIMNAISSGLLVFAGLVELLAEDFLSDESWHTLVGRKRVVACVYVVAGAFGMALVGAWA
ncbi:Zinc/iron permease [Wilcoxina mikolae CBS 423.85]|nr:Zinc/iron permease [Wilcoxina mikolae CBS 423.85]